MRELKASDIEVAVANYFNPRRHLIVPNISWGMGLHECDLLVMNGQNYGVEIEIKVSKADVKKDGKKKHGHDSHKIRRLFFAIPLKLFTDDIVAMIPERAGILVVLPAQRDDLYGNTFISPPRCVLKRNAKINKYAKPFSDSERIEMGRLGMLRYWNIRNKNKEWNQEK